MDAGKSLADKSRRPKKLKKSADSDIEAEIVRLKREDPALTTRGVKIQGLNGQPLSNATIWKIWKKHGV